jgi:hypothetical protein
MKHSVGGVLYLYDGRIVICCRFSCVVVLDMKERNDWNIPVGT